MNGIFVVLSSCASKPWIAWNTSAASDARRAIGPSLSIVHESAIAPRRLTRPNVGRRLEQPQRDEGERIEPQVSEPIAKATQPDATAAAGPAEEPLEPCSSFQGLRVRPPNHSSSIASSPSESLATRTAPAASSFSTTAASASKTWFS